MNDERLRRNDERWFGKQMFQIIVIVENIRNGAR